jgi:hypothetical protein
MLLWHGLRKLYHYLISEYQNINYFYVDFKLSPWNEYWFLVLGFLHGVRGEFTDDVSVAAVGPETSLGNLPRTPCRIPKAESQKYFHLSVQENHRTSLGGKVWGFHNCGSSYCDVQSGRLVPVFWRNVCKRQQLWFFRRTFLSLFVRNKVPYPYVVSHETKQNGWSFMWI